MPNEDKVQRTICQFCHTNCGILVHKSGNNNISIKGDPDHPINRGVCCPKAAAIPEVINGKDRLRHPRVKTPTGFKEVSWDEALAIAAERLGEIRSKHGPNSIVRCTGAPVSYQCRDGFTEFMGAFGSPNMTGAANICMVPRMTAFNAVMGEIRAEPDYGDANLVLLWATNPSASERYSAYAAYNGFMKIIPGLKERGARIISIDPFRTKTVEQADEWIRINPGTDAALGLAMIHVIINEGLYDKGFVGKYTSGFEALRDHVQLFDPKWAAGITGIAEKEIADLARIYAQSRSAAIYEGNGLDMYANGVDAVRTIATLIALTGNLDVPGGNVFMPFVPQSRLPSTGLSQEGRIGLAKFPIFGEVPFPAVKESLLSGDEDRPRAMIVHHSNPVLVQANENRTRHALEKFDFLMVNEIYPTATSEMADLVLPMTSDFESYGYRAYASVEGGFLAMARPIADPPGLARPVFEVEYELAERMGLHGNYPFHDTVSWLSHMIKPSGITFEQLDEEQIVYATPAITYRKYIDKGFNTSSGKVEFYSGSFEEKGCSALPVYSDPAGEPLNKERLSEQGFSLMGSSMRPGQFVHTKLKNIKVLSKTYSEPFLWIHPDDADARGIDEKEMVRVSSPQGEIKIKARLCRETNPGLIWVDFGWGNPTDNQPNINMLTNDKFFDPVSGGYPCRIYPCEVVKVAEVQ